jgi:hypothetical protein
MQDSRNTTPDRCGKSTPAADAPSQESEETQPNGRLPAASATLATDGNKPADMLACAKQGLAVTSGAKEANDEQAIMRKAQELISAINEQCDIIDELRKRMGRGEEGASPRPTKK